jgi:hypothetical protein
LTKEFTMIVQRSLRDRLRFRPQVESLEGRLVPTVTIQGNGAGSLTLSGTVNQAHSYEVMDDGKGDVTVTADGFTRNFTNISAVSINGGNKSTAVLYMLTGPVTQHVNVSANFRGGSNRFTAVVESDILAGGDVSFMVSSGGGAGPATGAVVTPGRDLMDVSVFGGVDVGGSLAVNFNPKNVAASESVSLLGGGTIAGTVRLDLEGVRGNESQSILIRGNIGPTGLLTATERCHQGSNTESISFSGQDRGTLLLQAFGGSGNDTISVEADLAAGSNGAVIASALGGPGNDTLNLAVRTQPGDNPFVSTDLDGGPGKNTAMETPNVTVFNVKQNRGE